MTLFDVEELTAYCAEHPPVHVLLAAALGIGGKGRGASEASPTGPAAAEADAVLSGLGPGFRTGDVHAGLGPAALDFAELKRRNGAGH